jgi:DNA-binding beta-propeller fold protein YncE
MLDARSGVVLRAISLVATPYTFAPAPDCLAVDTRGGRVLVASTSTASLSVLDAGSGALLRTIRLGHAPIGVAVDNQTGRVFVLNQGSASSAGSVTVLDASGGAIVSSVGVGTTPDAIAVDGGEARVFVVNENGAQNEPSLWDAMPAWLRRMVPWLTQPSRGSSAPGSVSVLDAGR